LPTTLGTLSTSDKGIASLAVAAGARCSTEINAHQIDLAIDLSPNALPWRDVLLFTTLVDGRPWAAADDLNATYAPEESWTGRAQDKVYLNCDDDSDAAFVSLSEGTHQIVVEASLPGTNIVLTSDTVTVELSCETGKPDPPEADSMAGCSVQGRAHSVYFAMLFLALCFLRVRRVNIKPARDSSHVSD